MQFITSKGFRYANRSDSHPTNVVSWHFQIQDLRVILESKTHSEEPCASVIRLPAEHLLLSVLAVSFTYTCTVCTHVKNSKFILLVSKQHMQICFTHSDSLFIPLHVSDWHNESLDPDEKLTFNLNRQLHKKGDSTYSKGVNKRRHSPGSGKCEKKTEPELKYPWKCKRPPTWAILNSKKVQRTKQYKTRGY